MTLLATLRKDTPFEIRLEAGSLWGREVFSLRPWLLNAAGEPEPGEWGIAFTPELLGDVLRMFSEIARRSEERGGAR